MKCHYIHDDIAGKVLIPGCMQVAISNDIDLCTCGEYYHCKTDKELISYLREKVHYLQEQIKILNEDKKCGGGTTEQ